MESGFSHLTRSLNNSVNLGGLTLDFDMGLKIEVLMCHKIRELNPAKSAVFVGHITDGTIVSRWLNSPAFFRSPQWTWTEVWTSFAWRISFRRSATSLSPSKASCPCAY